MDIRILQYFLAVVREESITKAAERLNMTQPPLSRQLKDLEDELGKQLLIRGSKKVTLTEDGMLLKKRAEELVDLMEKTKAELTSSNENINGEVHIGCGETEGISFLAQAAWNLQQEHPLVHYHIYSGDAERVMERLDKGLIDFGIIFGTPDTKKYEALKLPSKDIWGVLMRKDSPLAGKEAISPEDLWNQPLLISQQETEGGRMSQWMKRRLSELDIIMTYNLLFNASLFVEEGLGYAICFDRIINTSGDSMLCFRPLSPSIEIEMYMIWKKYQVFSKPAEKFLMIMQENMQ